jgi:hypothetical protein
VELWIDATFSKSHIVYAFLKLMSDDEKVALIIGDRDWYKDLVEDNRDW